MISRYYDIDDKLLASFLHHLSYVRNICAHHGRLWNRKFVIKTAKPKHPRFLSDSFNTNKHEYLFNTLVMLEYMMNIINPEHHWKERLIRLLHKHKAVNLNDMGFPDNWKNTGVWNTSTFPLINKLKSKLCTILTC